MDDTDDLPPFVRTWPQLYGLVMGSLALEIIVFYLLMQVFS